MNRILLFEDDDSIAYLIAHRLEAIGFKVTHFINPNLIQWKKIKNNFDLIVTDHMMPEMTGLQFTWQYRYIDRHIPIYMISASNDHFLPFNFIARGGSEYFDKGDIEKLVRIIKERHYHERSKNPTDEIQI